MLEADDDVDQQSRGFSVANLNGGRGVLVVARRMTNQWGNTTAHIDLAYLEYDFLYI